MKIFYDCEFIERGRLMPIQLVSIGMVAEDGTAIYRVNGECLGNVTRHLWLRQFVVPYLPVKNPAEGIFEWDKEHPEYEFLSPTMEDLADDLLAFLRLFNDVELWAYYGAYDHVCLAQTFGVMAELPAGVPMFTHELQQHYELFGKGRSLPPEPWHAHHAMEDARWAMGLYEAIENDTLSEEEKPVEYGEVIEGVIEA